MPRPLSIAIGLLMIAVVVGTIGWLLVRAVRNSDDPPKFIFKLLLSVVLAGGLLWFSSGGANLAIPFACVAFGVAMSVMWAPHLGALLAKPITSLFDGGDTELE